MKSLNNKELEDNLKEKWYLKTWFICLIFIFGLPFPPALIVGGILLYKQNVLFKKIFSEYGKIDDLNNTIESKMNEIRILEEDIENSNRVFEKEYKAYTDKMNNNKNKLKKELQELKDIKENVIKHIQDLDKDYTYELVDTFDYEDITSQEIKNELAMLKIGEKDLIKDSGAIEFLEEIDKKQIANNLERQILRCFNSECTTIIKSVTISNIDSTRSKILKSFDIINNMFKTSNILLKNEILEIKLKELNFQYNFILKQNQEKEIQRAIREQMLEEEKVRKEIELEKKRIEKEEKQFSNEINKLMSYMQKSSNDVEKQLYIDKIKELEEQITLLEKDKVNVLDREHNTRAGFVYVISNIGSFGENVYKIGMTRRLEPMDRIKELSSASVPFPFDVHAMIFSEDAPKLENILHKEFKENEVNKVNTRKEFFDVDLKRIEKVVKDNYNEVVDFTHFAQADEYRQTLKYNQEAM